MSQAGCLIVLLSHNGCLGNFFIYQAIRHHDLHFLHRCVIHLYVVLNADNFSKKQLHVGSVTIPRIKFHLSLRSCSSPTWQWDRADILTEMMCIERIFEELSWFFYVRWTVRLNEFKYNQQDAKLHNGIYYFKCSTYFRLFLRPSSGAQNTIPNIGYLSSLFCFLPLTSLGDDSSNKQKKLDKYPMLCIRFWAPDDGRRNSLKRVEYL